MKQFFRKKSVRVLLVTVAVLLFILWQTAMGGSVVLQNLFGVTLSPLEKVSAEAVYAAEEALQSAAVTKGQLQEENRALQEEVYALRQQLAEYEQMQHENQQLRNFLELKQENPDFTFAYGTVISRSGEDAFYTFRVDQGTLHGVSKGDVVLTEAGLCGVVSSVSVLDCTVQTLYDPAIRVSALDSKSRDTGVVTGEHALSEEGLLRFAYLEADHKVQEGDVIVTSGIGGNFPKNLLIGTAKAVFPSDTDVTLYATVEPFVNPATIKDVVILTSFAGQSAGSLSSEVTP